MTIVVFSPHGRCFSGLLIEELDWISTS